MHSANIVSGFIYDKYSIVSGYLNLKEANDDLLKENARLRNRLPSAYKVNSNATYIKTDTAVFFQQYTYTPAKVINNSTDKMYNYITLNKGSSHGIKPDMGVITSNGVVGVVRKVSSSFSSVVSLLNKRIGISAKIKKNDYYGMVIWEGGNYAKATLKEIPNHVDIQKGDTIITSGYSAIFPEGIVIGKITRYEIEEGGNFYEITIELSTNFKTLTHVYIVSNLMRKEQLELEKTTEND